MSVTRKNHEQYKGINWEEELVKYKERRKGIDDRLIHFLQDARNNRLDRFMIFVTRTGNGGTIWILIALYLYIFKKMHTEAMLLVSVIGVVAFFANIVIKSFFTKDRPCDIDESVSLLIKRPLGSSTPSGHSASSFACVVVFFFINPWWGMAALSWAALIAFSRIYLYVHYPSDVFFGCVLGVTLAVASIPMVNWLLSFV